MVIKSFTNIYKLFIRKPFGLPGCTLSSKRSNWSGLIEFLPLPLINSLFTFIMNHLWDSEINDTCHKHLNAPQREHGSNVSGTGPFWSLQTFPLLRGCRRFKFSPDVLFVSSGLLLRGDSALLHPHHPVGHQMEIFLSHNRTVFILRARP